MLLRIDEDRWRRWLLQNEVRVTDHGIEVDDPVIQQWQRQIDEAWQEVPDGK